MPFLSDAILSLPLPQVDSEHSASRSAIEEQVVALFDELRDRLLRYLLCLGLSAHDGEDVIQESFLLLFQHLQAGKSQSNIRGWVFRVSRNLALKRLNSSQRSKHSVVHFDTELEERCRDLSANPEEQFGTRQRQKQLLAVVSALPERDRNCLSLRAEGLRYREIAEVLDISLGSVATSMARALARLGCVDGGLEP